MMVHYTAKRHKKQGGRQMEFRARLRKVKTTGAADSKAEAKIPGTRYVCAGEEGAEGHKRLGEKFAG